MSTDAAHGVGSGPAARIGAWAVRRPRLTLALWLALIVPCAIIGIGAPRQMHDTGIAISGTATDAAVKDYNARFGKRSDAWIMLDGSAKEVARARIVLSRRLTGTSGPLVGPVLHGRGAAELYAIQIPGVGDDAIRKGAPAVRRIVEDTDVGGAKAYLISFPDISGAIITTAASDLKQFELLSAPVLLIILLLVFRTPLAALLPLIIGGTTTAASIGMLALINRATPLDAYAINFASMIGLALGVDYALVLVSRYREEAVGSRSPAEAAEAAAASAGHTVSTAGVVVVAVLVASALISPGDLLTSVSIGIVIAVAFSVIGGLLAIPALLTLTGQHINKYPLFGKAVTPGGGRFSRWVSRPHRRPLLTGGLCLLALGFFSIPAFGMRTGPPTFWTLPAGTPQREDYQAIARLLPGSAIQPYQILVSVDHGTLTDPRRLAALARWQRRLAGRRDVTAIFGPAALEPRTRALHDGRKQLRAAKTALSKQTRDGRRLASGLGQAQDGIQQLRDGLAQAAAGAAALSDGGSAAAAGARQLHAGLTLAQGGSAQLRRGARDAEAGAAALGRGASAIAAGDRKLARGLKAAVSQTAAAEDGLGSLTSGLRSGSTDLTRLAEPVDGARQQLDEALAELARAPASAQALPQYAAALAAAQSARDAVGTPATPGSVAAGLADAGGNAADGADGAARLLTGITALRSGLRDGGAAATTLASGAETLRRGTQQEVSGLSALMTGATQLDRGMQNLAVGSAALTSGVERLQAGGSGLASGLGDGVRRAVPLAAGLARMRRAVDQSLRATDALNRQIGASSKLVAATRSGYLPLAVIETGPAKDRAGVSTMLNTDRGGNTAVVTVFGRGDATRWGHPLRAELVREQADLARSIGGRTQLIGPATQMQDYDHLARQRLPWMIFALTLTAFLALTVMLRSAVLAAIAVGLNLITVAVAFGALAWAYSGTSPALGGGGYLISISVFGVFSMTFALSIDYTLFLMLRMQEGYERLGSTEAAVAYGLRTTSSVVTGAAASMIGLFLVFTGAHAMTLRQVGLGLAVAIIVDATVVRLVLLPTAMRLCGDACWREPRFMRSRTKAEASPQAVPR